MGAPRLHVVDLDGAATGEIYNMDIIKAMASAILVPIQLGGGIRKMETIERMLKAGMDRVILGTAAVENSGLVREAIFKFNESIVVSIDTRDGHIATRGWQQEIEIPAIEFAKSMTKLGIKRFIFTDISRDGTLSEPNFTAIAEFIDAIQLPIIAAGGISSLTHLKILKQLGVEGAIVGRALYTGDINLKQALDTIG